MTPLENFARITRHVIADVGIEGYVPTVLYPERRHLVGLEDVPADVDIEAVVLEWAADSAVGDEEFIVAFVIAPGSR